MKSKPQESPVLRFAAYDHLPAFVELCTAYVESDLHDLGSLFLPLFTHPVIHERKKTIGFNSLILYDFMVPESMLPDMLVNR